MAFLDDGQQSLSQINPFFSLKFVLLHIKVCGMVLLVTQKSLSQSSVETNKAHSKLAS